MTLHFCYDVGRHVSNRCFGTPSSATTLLLRGQAHSDQCFGTPASATTLLLRGQARSVQCFDTPASCYGTQYCTVPSGTYCVMSYSFSITSLGNPTVI